MSDITALYADGYSMSDIAAQVGSTYGTVRNHLLRAGIKLRPSSTPTTTDERRRIFWENVDKNGPTPQPQEFKFHPLGDNWQYNETTNLFEWVGGHCWMWTGWKTPRGYGQFQVGGKMLAHRFAIEDTYGFKLGDWVAMHDCDNPACVRPSHFWFGNNKYNMFDKALKGRAHLTQATKDKIGAANRIALRGKKQSAEQIRKRSEKIKQRYAAGLMKNKRSDISTDEIVALYRQLRSMPKVAAQLRVSIPTVHRRLILAGVQRTGIAVSKSK